MKGGPKIEFYICATDRFTYHPLTVPMKTELVNILETLAEDNKFAFRHYQEVLRAVSKHHVDWKVVGIPSHLIPALQHVQAVEMPSQDRLLAWVPPKLLDSLYDYQKEGVAFVVARGGKCMIADEMGVGKSRQGLALLATYKQQWPALIICPSSLKGQWASMIQEHLEVVPKVAQSGKDILDGPVNIVSYDLAANKASELSARNFQVVLVDESHYLKSRDAKRTKTLMPILGKAKRIVLMSGTPALNRPVELFTQLFLLRRDLFPNFHAFGQRYCGAKQSFFGWQYDGASNLKELNVIMESTCMIRRRKDQVLGELPEKTRSRVGLKLTDTQKAVIEKSVRKLATVSEKAKESFVDPITQKAAFLTVVRDVGQAKIPSVLEYVHQLLDEGEKFLLFAHHQAVLDEIDTYLQNRGVERIRIDGKVQAKHRTALVDAFQTDDNIRVALLSITAAGTGLTLTAARVVVFAELYFCPGNLLQAEDRAHRVGQTQPVSIRYLVAEGTADDRIWWMLSHKLSVLGKITGQDDVRWGAERSTFESDSNLAACIGAILEQSVDSEPMEEESSGWNRSFIKSKLATQESEKITSHFESKRQRVEIPTLPKKVKNNAPPNWRPPE